MRARAVPRRASSPASPEAQDPSLPPLNRSGVLDIWAPLDPGRFLDMNPTLLEDDTAGRWVVFCRYGVPPRPGQGSIWAVQVDEDLRPAARPLLLVDAGIDPRVVAVGGRALLFFATLERDATGAFAGSSMMVGEFSVGPHGWAALRAFALPKAPIPDLAQGDAWPNWEKNWIPFAVDEHHVGLIYAHDPWRVLVLRVAAGEEPRLLAAHAGEPVRWLYGTVRGGAPPVPFDDRHLVTIFHSSQVVAGRSVYMAGACVFERQAPFAPKWQTTLPLYVSPHRQGVERFGWGFSGSVLFPAGARRTGETIEILAGRDDGEIVTARLPMADLRAALRPVRPAESPCIHALGRPGHFDVPAEGAVLVPADRPDLVPDQPALTAARLLARGSRTAIVLGAGVGAMAITLGGVAARVVAAEARPEMRAWLLRNIALHGGGVIEVVDDEAALGTIDDCDILVIGPDGGGGDAAVEPILHKNLPLLLMVTGPTAPSAGRLASLGYVSRSLQGTVAPWSAWLPAGGRCDLSWFI